MQEARKPGFLFYCNEAQFKRAENEEKGKGRSLAFAPYHFGSILWVWGGKGLLLIVRNSLLLWQRHRQPLQRAFFSIRRETCGRHLKEVLIREKSFFCKVFPLEGASEKVIITCSGLRLPK